MKPINVSIVSPLIIPVSVAAAKAPNKDNATKSKSLNEKLIIININIMKIVTKRGTFTFLSDFKG